MVRADSTRMLDDLITSLILRLNRTTRHPKAAISSSSSPATSQLINKTINNVGLNKTTKMEHLVINMVRTISPRTHHSSRWANFLTTTEATTVAINSNRTLTRRKINRNSRSNNVQGKTTNHDPTKASNTPTRSRTTTTNFKDKARDLKAANRTEGSTNSRTREATRSTLTLHHSPH